MKTNKAIIALIIVVVLGGFFAAIFLLGRTDPPIDEFSITPNDESAEPTDEFSVKSNDASAELFIPKGALPGNVDQDDISVTRISNNPSEDESWIDYELEPDGLEFIDEILLKVQLDNDDDTFPIVLISNGNGVDLVNNTRTEVDLENNTKIVSIPLTHFSTIAIKSAGAFGIKVSAEDTMVDEQVNTTASFTLYKTKVVKTYSETDIWVF